MAASPFLTRTCTTDPMALDVLSALDRPVEPMEPLSRWKDLEVLRIAALDLLGETPLETVGASLADLADGLLVERQRPTASRPAAVTRWSKQGGPGAQGRERHEVVGWLAVATQSRCNLVRQAADRPGAPSRRPLRARAVSPPTRPGAAGHKPGVPGPPSKAGRPPAAPSSGRLAEQAGPNVAAAPGCRRIAGPASNEGSH